MSEWISVKERLPEIGCFVITFRTHWPSFYWMGEYKGVSTEEEDMFNHWIPLPKPPEKE